MPAPAAPAPILVEIEGVQIRVSIGMPGGARRPRYLIHVEGLLPIRRSTESDTMAGAAGDLAILSGQLVEAQRSGQSLSAVIDYLRQLGPGKGHRSRGQAGEAARDRARAVANPAPLSPTPGVRVSDFARWYLARRGRDTNYSTPSLVRDRDSLERFIYDMGDVPLATVSRAVVTAWRDKLAGPGAFRGRPHRNALPDGRISPATVNTILRHFKSALSYAVDQDALGPFGIEGDPADWLAKIRRVKQLTAGEVRAAAVGEKAWDPADLRRVFEQFPIEIERQRASGSPLSRQRLTSVTFDMARVAIATSARSGGLTGLRFEDVALQAIDDPAAPRLAVVTLYAGEKEALHIPVGPATIRIIEARAAERGMVLGAGASGLVWVMDPAAVTGKPYRVSAVGNQFTRVRRLSGVRRGSFHSLRHTAVSLLLARGVDPRTVQAMAGHSTFAVTQKYARAYPTLLAGASAHLNELAAME